MAHQILEIDKITIIGSVGNKCNIDGKEKAIEFWEKKHGKK